MRRFIAGVLVGLLLAAASSTAEWGWGDMDLLKALVQQQTSQTTSLAWQARSQERIAKVLEQIANCHPCPAERK